MFSLLNELPNYVVEVHAGMLDLMIDPPQPVISYYATF
jgi:hypothetical protein